MSIAHELSSEIAIAILTRKEQTVDLNDLKEIVLRVHNTLQNLTSPEPHTRKRILCTEDDPDSRDMLVLLLRNHGFEVRCATNGNEALELAKTEHFDLLLLDNWMPGASGVEVTRAVRKFKRTTPILFYSGATSDADERAALEAGAQIYLKKPTGIESLIGEIRKLIAE